MAAPLVVTFGVRFHREELAELHAIANENGVPTGTVIRQMVRHFLIERKEGRPAPPDLGSITWGVPRAFADLNINVTKKWEAESRED